MLQYRAMTGIFLVVVWCGSNFAIFGDDLGRAPSPTAPRDTSQAAEDAEPKVDQVLLQLVVVELRGDVQRAFKETGFRDSAAGNRFIPGQAGRLESDSAALSALLKSMSNHAEVNVLSRPQVRTLMGHSASVQISSSPPRIPYLVRTGTKSFELRESDGEASLGIMIDLTPRADDDSREIELSPLKVSITTLDGREPIRGVDLDVGKPIISTRTLETSITLIDGAESSGIAIPGPAGRTPVLFIRGQRVKVTPGATLPSPLPEPAPPAGTRR